jgi:hypothetical protein
MQIAMDLHIISKEQPSHFKETDEAGEIKFICEPI